MIHPVILCGGSGTRLWPLSRRAYPKQFTRLLGPESLFQACLRRLGGPGFAPPVVVSGDAFRFLAAGQIAELGLEGATLLLEPAPRNTAPAILCAALHLQAAGRGEALMLAAPSDHVIRDPGAFRAAVAAGAAAAEAGALVTFGVRPDRPETGYGYLEIGEAEGAAALPVRRFVEKPDAPRAAEMLRRGGYLWNTGLFLFRVRSVIEAFAAHAPEMLAPCRAAVAGAAADLDFLRLDPAGFAAAPDTSIDYAIMEKAANVVTVPLPAACGWSDLGAWDAVRREMAADGDGVAAAGPVTAIGCADSLLRAEAGGPRVVGLGLDRIAVISTRDAVLVANMGDLQAVKEVVARLKAEGAPEAETQPRVYRPWGWYETLALGARFQVKQIVVRPGGRLSLQSHVHRAEHWVVVQGTATVTLGETVSLLTENQSVYIPLGARHRLENPGKLDLHLVEVQTGGYLGEDDITRYDDVYNRG